MSLRLAYLDPHPVPDVTPSALQILQNVDAMAAVGIEVHLVTPESGALPDMVLGRPLSSGAHLHGFYDFRRRWYFPFSSNKPYYWQVWDWLKEHAMDAVYVRNLKLADWLLQKGITQKLPLFFETHEIFAQTYRDDHSPLQSRQHRTKYEALQQRERVVYNQSSGIFALTSYLLKDMRRDYETIQPTWVLPDGVDLTAVEHAYSETPWERHDPFKLLYLGSLHSWKGVETLLQAMRDTAGCRLTIAGGPDTRIAALHQQATQLGVADKVVFVGAVVPSQRFVLIAEHDVCLLPLSQTNIGSRYTSPLKLFEYMAMRKPIVVADLPSVREVLQHEESALLCEAQNPQAIAQAIRRLQDDAILAERLGQNARELALHYSWQKRAEMVRDKIIQQL